MTPTIVLIRAELFKLRTARLSYGLLGTGAGLTVIFSLLEAARSGPGKAVPPLNTVTGLTSVVAGGTWTLLMASVLGGIVSSGEFRHSTATLTYLATPHRGRVLAAKTTAAALAGAVFGLAGYLIAVGAALGFVAARGYQVPVGDATLIRYGLGHIVAAALLAAIGAALGSLVRSQLAVTIGILVWMVVAESLLGGLFKQVQPYLPYTAATTLGGTQLGGASFGPAHGASTTVAPLPFAAATALLAAVAAVVSLVAVRTTVRRDVA
jgi:ABC-type transport system involved in multi-copper enzyme maturation permease subunit